MEGVHYEERNWNVILDVNTYVCGGKDKLEHVKVCNFSDQKWDPKWIKEKQIARMSLVHSLI